jgi:nitrite reductase/ring-hydroxylating ferredoxin subunit
VVLRGRLDQLPDKGDCLLVEVAGESVIVLRGRDEAVRAFYNVCRHRGSRLIRTNPLPDAADAAIPAATIAAGRVSQRFAASYFGAIKPSV